MRRTRPTDLPPRPDVGSLSSAAPVLALTRVAFFPRVDSQDELGDHFNEEHHAFLKEIL